MTYNGIGSKLFLILLVGHVLFPRYSKSQSTNQTKLAFPDARIFTSVLTVTGAEESMYSFRKKYDLAGYGGWKWYSRFLAEYAPRAATNGALPSATEYYKILKKATTKMPDLRSAGGWYPIGPFYKPEAFGNLVNYGMSRVNCIAFHPTNENTWYIGVAQGGIWRTTDSGNSWTELNSGLPILRVSDIAIDPNNVDVLYACIGDFEYCEISLLSADRKRNTHYGMGVFKSINGGASWFPTGLSAAQTDFDGSLFRRVIVNPKNSNELVAVGISGIYKSMNAGISWNKVTNHVIGDLEIVDNNTEVLYAAGRYLEFSNEGKATIYKSVDFGNTWQTLNTPWNPADSVTRIELALAPNDSNYVYAICVGKNGGVFNALYLSTNAGKNWSSQYNGGENLMAYTPWSNDEYSQGKYDLALCVDPANKMKLFLGGIRTLYSDNGGASFGLIEGYGNHVDEHQFKIHPISKKWFLCNDGGLYTMSSSPIKTTFANAKLNNIKWNACDFRINNMNVGAFYRLGVKPLDTNVVLAGQQDNGTIISQWNFVTGGDGMECAAWDENASSTEIISSSQYGNFFKFSDGNYDPNFFDQNVKAGEGEWTTPMLLNISYDMAGKYHFLEDIYLGYDQVVNYQNSWQDLSSFTNTRPLTAMDCSNYQSGFMYIAKKPDYFNTIPTQIFRRKLPFTSGNWKDITKGLPDSIYITDIATNPKKANLAYVCYSGFYDGLKIFKTSDTGNTWVNISHQLPNLPVNAVIADPEDKHNGIYIGTDIGIYYYNDSMAAWQLFSKNMPNVIVTDLKIEYGSRTMYAATFGRALWACPLPKYESPTKKVVNYFEPVNIRIINPINGNIQIILGDEYIDLMHADLLNCTGQKVAEIPLHSGLNQTEVSDLKTGIYYLRIFSGKELITVEKVLIEK